jgi:D-3-phosphoglycerate dehydrogenase
MAHKVLISDSIADAAVAMLKARSGLEIDYSPGLKEDALAAKIPGFDALIIRSGSKVTAKVIEASTTLKVIGRAGIGVDNVDIPAATKKGIVVMNTPTANAITTAEHAIAMLFSIARKIPQATSSMKAGKWEKNAFVGRELAGKTLGILGLGTIGRLVAERARGLFMIPIAYDPYCPPDRAKNAGVELVSLDDLLARADAITAHVVLTNETKGMIGDAQIEKMKKGVLLVNCARGGVYDEAALKRGIESGKIGGLALDVFAEEPPPKDHPLLALDQVVLTPHIGASTVEAQDKTGTEIAAQIAAFLLEGRVMNAVNKVG